MKKEEHQCYKIVNILNDLPDSPESWKSSSIAERVNEIISDYRLVYEKAPHQNNRPIRCYFFNIKPCTQLHHLLYLAKKIKKRLNIECFQISIDRKGGQAYMAIDIYDRSVHKNIDLYKNRINILRAITIQTLSLELPKDSEQGCIYYKCVKEEYEEDPLVFKKLKKWVLRNSLTSKNRQIMNNMIDYIEKKCQGTAK